MGFTGISASLDTLLSSITLVAWWLLGVYVVYQFLVSIFRHGFRLAVIRLFSFRILLPLLFVVGLSLLSSALVFIQPQSVGVVVSLVASGGVRPQPLSSGLHWIIPFLERDIVYPIYWQTYTMSGKPNEGEKLGDDSIRARTSDGQEVRLDCSVIFRISASQAVLVHIDWQNRYISDLVRPVVRGVVRRHVSQFTVREVNSRKRKDLETTLDQHLRELFLNRGFILDQFLLRDITFTEEYAASVEKKQSAFERIEQTAHQKDQMINLATGRAESVKIEARAQAEALRLIAGALELNQNLLTYQYIDKLAPNFRAMLVPSETPLILPLPELEALKSEEIQRPASGTKMFSDTAP
ncbi:hypothetical protein C2W62_13455 [Candidatus Entotheonella serta]|nr:hypothetical protein C2W62_13455 [Candidatus Entotheonella serta]